MKISELRDKSLEELTQLLDEKQQLMLSVFRMAKATGQLVIPMKSEAIVARLLQIQTLINEKQRGDS